MPCTSLFGDPSKQVSKQNHNNSVRPWLKDLRFMGLSFLKISVQVCFEHDMKMYLGSSRDFKWCAPCTYKISLEKRVWKIDHGMRMQIAILTRAIYIYQFVSKYILMSFVITLKFDHYLCYTPHLCIFLLTSHIIKPTFNFILIKL